jgi:hypothetical protein
MTKVLQPYACNVCGKSRERDANHWVLVWISKASGSGQEQFLCERWWERRAEAHYIKHACGQACAQKLFERWLATGSLEDVKSAQEEVRRQDAGATKEEGDV